LSEGARDKGVKERKEILINEIDMSVAIEEGAKVV
jgi:hypothetical protein